MNRTARGAAALVLAALVVFAGVAVTSVDFAAMESQTEARSTVAASATNGSGAALDDTLSLYVAEEGPFADAVADALVAAFAAEGVTATRVDSLAGLDGPVLAVAVPDYGFDYTPWSSEGAATVRFVYSSVGNTTAFEAHLAGENGVVGDESNPYVMLGDVSLTDRSTGLMSLPAYDRHVTAATADETVTRFLAEARASPR
ncbi:hypothetical protein [Halomarina litorea]|uniref:hypothetical protein n=1 Tax=Halomarina litorea TaxID=2961595 RepID=UPI0020C4E1BE|nr:hypothetical protein [Halomarina sp. BCD28]